MKNNIIIFIKYIILEWMHRQTMDHYYIHSDMITKDMTFIPTWKVRLYEFFLDRNYGWRDKIHSLSDGIKGKTVFYSDCRIFKLTKK